ncbi:MAG: hypothetical protein JWN26_77 [Candidatus Saccharibacteria bacterium]|nr:hypothetical protein [Candidatus Saccharibacteria bacterium]
MNDAKTKQQLVEKIVSSTNVLVTVSNNPSVDALSAAIALTVMLNKIGKHTTAIFSGATPPAITFLDPAKTFETSIDSLRDFIIALDKEKADHLRYKVEGEAVKIFITPYRTTLSSDDLEFSQGDYNVELVLALGVENQSHLDGALEAHGSILHDATVITISNESGTSSLGSIDWRDDTASSLSEMLVSLSELLQADTPLIDQQIATALLTGIVAETDRFSNIKTSSKVMTVAAQLMAAGADQQLIASKLQESHEIGDGATPTGNDSPYTKPLGQSSKPTREGLAIAHDEPSTTAPQEPATVAEPMITSEPPAPEPYVAPPIDTPAVSEPPVIGKLADAYALDPELDSAPTPVASAPAPLLGGIASPLAPVTPPPLPVESTPAIDPLASLVPPTLTPLVAPTTTPTFSGIGIGAVDSPVVTPPSEEISKHSYIGGDTSTYGATVSGAPDSSAQSIDIFAAPAPAPETTSTDPAIPPADLSSSVPEERSRDESSRDDALAAVSAAYGGPSVPSFSPAPGITLPPPPPLPDFGALPTAVPAPSPYALDPAPQPERLGDILAPPPQPASNDPGQFKIPGQ